MDMNAELEQLEERANRARDEAAKKAAPWVKKRDALLDKIQPLEAELRDLNKKIKELEHPARDAGRVLATIARAKSPQAVVDNQRNNALAQNDVTTGTRKKARRRGKKVR